MRKLDLVVRLAARAALACRASCAADAGGSGPPAIDDDGAAHPLSEDVFAGSGSSWVQQGKLVVDNPGAQYLLGSAVSVSGDTALVGTSSHDPYSSGNGAYVFLRSGTSWAEPAHLMGSDGYSVSVSGDTAVVGNRANEDSAHFGYGCAPSVFLIERPHDEPPSSCADGACCGAACEAGGACSYRPPVSGELPAAPWLALVALLAFRRPERRRPGADDRDRHAAGRGRRGAQPLRSVKRLAPSTAPAWSERIPWRSSLVSASPRSIPPCS